MVEPEDMSNVYHIYGFCHNANTEVVSLRNATCLAIFAIILSNDLDGTTSPAIVDHVGWDSDVTRVALNVTSVGVNVTQGKHTLPSRSSPVALGIWRIWYAYYSSTRLLQKAGKNKAVSIQ
ncbi:hypothetical protein Bbelb_431780 [Branchiostoma belcheri]|nr:hypothetical protein Bbelb_431780 [Branchiostoma belcheri]